MLPVEMKLLVVGLYLSEGDIKPLPVTPPAMSTELSGSRVAVCRTCGTAVKRTEK